MGNRISFQELREDIIESLFGKDSFAELRVLAPSGVEIDERDWPLKIQEVITEESVTYESDKVTVKATEEGGENGFELQSNNYTGGDYCDLKQYVTVSGTVYTTEDSAGRVVIDTDLSDVLCEVEFEVRNVESYGGESPPY